jgi:glycosyltransferase involved in cell wall biosynthesis
MIWLSSKTPSDERWRGRRGVLFVSHDATRTGAPIALLHFLHWFKKNGNRPFSVLLPGPGELLSDFENLADTWTIDRSRWCADGLRSQLLHAKGLGAWARRALETDVQRFAVRCRPALVYVNSISSAWMVDMLPPQVPVLTHVHELDFLFRILASPAVSRLLAKSRQFIACSNAVKQSLVCNHALPTERVETIYESIPMHELRVERTRQHVLKELRIPENALIVIGSGTVDWVKGTDLFVQLARVVCQSRPRAYFAWIGGGPSRELAQFEHDIRQVGLSEKVRLTGAVSNSADYLSAADVFVLTSRQDSYPLVCLEAAALGKPIVCFSDAGGMPEFVEEDCGFVTPYLDITAMADRVVSLLDSQEYRARMGAAARSKVVQRHDVSGTAPSIMKVIERNIESS